MASRGVFVLAGGPGRHKSTIAAETFQPAMYVKSGKTVSHYYDNVYGPKRGLNPIAHPIWIGLDHIDGNPVMHPVTGQPLTSVPIVKTLTDMLAELKTAGRQAKLAGMPPPVSWLIFDEAPTFWQRVFDEFESKSKTADGRPDTRKAYGLLGQWSKHFIEKLKELNELDIGSVLICHEQEPDKEEGKIGGAKFPSQAVAKQVCGDADGVLLRLVEDRRGATATERPKAYYYWSCRASQWWSTKLRGLDLEDQDAIEKLSLGEILTTAGWDL